MSTEDKLTENVFYFTPIFEKYFRILFYSLSFSLNTLKIFLHDVFTFTASDCLLQSDCHLFVNNPLFSLPAFSPHLKKTVANTHQVCYLNHLKVYNSLLLSVFASFYSSLHLKI